MAKRICVPLLLLMTACGGCGFMRWLTYVFAPVSRTEAVNPTFPDLPGHSVAVVIFANQSIEFEYPYARLALSRRIAAELEQRVNKVKVIDPAVVLNYQDENVNWDSMGKTELGKVFKTDYVLLVSLMEYTAREPNSTNLYRGRIIAETGIYQTSLPEKQGRVWNVPSLGMVYPEDATAGLLSGEAGRILDETEQRFVDKLVKNFYKYRKEMTQ